MNKTIYFFKWNNIKNKIYKGKPQVTDATYNMPATNFNARDGVNTEHIVNIDDSVYNYDYVLVGTQQNNTAWYVTDVYRLSQNQVRITLKRDLIADYINDLKEQTFMIRRGHCEQSDSAIYNNEGMDFNQVKVGDELLKDKSESAWIIGYVPLGLTLTGESTFSTPELTNAETIAGINNIPIKNANDNYIYIASNSNIFANVTMAFAIQTIELERNLQILIFGNSQQFSKPGQTPTIGKYRINYNEGERIKDFSNSIRNETISQQSYWNNLIYTTLKGDDTHSLYNDVVIEQYDGKLYYDTINSKYYRVKIDRTAEKLVLSNEQLKISDGTLATTIRTTMLENERLEETTPLNPSNVVGSCEMTIDKYYISIIEEKPKGTYHYIPSEFTDDSVKVARQPYKMFAFPLNQFYTTRAQSVLTNPEETQTIVNNVDVISAFLSHWTKDNGRIIDLQLVPYCPCLDRIMSTGVQGAYDLYIGDSKCINLYDSTNKCVARGIWILNDSFTFNINYQYDIQDYKMELECDMLRLCSPHYEQAFEFNPVKMDGFSGFKVECTYKPFSPYIHIIPIYKNGSLYGTEQFKDARGLITTQAYSLPLASEQWATFQRTNSIYEIAFNRDINHLEIQNQQSVIKELFGLGTAGVGGAVAGGLKGGPMGAITGGLTGSAGGLLNFALNQQMRAENMSYKRDMYSYNLRNIQAQPQTLTKVSSIDINNRLFPVLEKYSCTNGEKLYFANYLLYNGYTINRIGKLKDYISPMQDYTFVQADFIRSTINNIDAHELSEIIDILSVGWYFMPIE